MAGLYSRPVRVPKRKWFLLFVLVVYMGHALILFLSWLKQQLSEDDFYQLSYEDHDLTGAKVAVDRGNNLSYLKKNYNVSIDDGAASTQQGQPVNESMSQLVTIKIEEKRKSVASLAKSTMWTAKDNSSSSQTQEESKEALALIEPSSSYQPRITFTLSPNGTFHNTFSPLLTCDVSPDRIAFPPILYKPSLFDFTTSISTNLNLLFMGDSVGVQFAQGMDEALGVNATMELKEQKPLIQEERQVLKYEWGNHEAITISKPSKGGGGIMATYRINGFLSHRRKKDWSPNVPPNINAFGSWMPQDVDMLYNSSLWGHIKTEDKKFDAMVFRIQHGWLTLQQITKDRLEELVKVAHELFGISTIIFPTIPFSNNIATVEDFELLHEVNDMIRNFVQSYQPPSSMSGVQQLMVMDFGNLIQLLMEQNAMTVGWDIHNTTHPYWLDRTYWPAKKVHKIQIRAAMPLVCSERVEPLTVGLDCRRNMFSVDGMHYCMGSIGNRIFAATACMLACVYNEQKGDNDLRKCEERCNEQYMSFESIHDNMWNTELM